MWELPGSGIKPTSTALAGGFLTSEPPGKPPKFLFLQNLHFSNNMLSWPNPLVYLLETLFDFVQVILVKGIYRT